MAKAQEAAALAQAQAARAEAEAGRQRAAAAKLRAAAPADAEGKVGGSGVVTMDSNLRSASLAFFSGLKPSMAMVYILLRIILHLFA